MRNPCLQVSDGSCAQECASLHILGLRVRNANSLFRGNTAIRGRSEMCVLYILGLRVRNANSLLIHITDILVRTETKWRNGAVAEQRT